MVVWCEKRARGSRIYQPCPTLQVFFRGGGNTVDGPDGLGGGLGACLPGYLTYPPECAATAFEAVLELIEVAAGSCCCCSFLRQAK